MGVNGRGTSLASASVFLCYTIHHDAGLTERLRFGKHLSNAASQNHELDGFYIQKKLFPEVARKVTFSRNPCPNQVSNGN